MYRTLIVARMAPGADGAVADAFARSDQTELPALLGVHGRALFRFHDLYFHLIESRGELGAGLDGVRQHPLFAGLNEELSHHITPYAPDWRGPRDAMAACFYDWRAPGARPAGPPAAHRKAAGA